MSNTWRLIPYENQPATWNMALDESLLYCAGSKISIPTLRLYGWVPGALSIGYAQPIQDVDPEKLKNEKWDLVRRPTGGRAIMHIDEVTYSVTAPLDDRLLSGSLLESYQTISRALLSALNKLGIDASAEMKYEQKESLHSPNPVCFETPSNFEITVQGKKLIGSAQARKYNGLLQHGSLPLFGDLSRITRVLKYENNEARDESTKRLLSRATNIESVLGKVPSKELVSQAIIDGFSETLGIHFEQSLPSPGELSFAEDLRTTKYNSANWTLRI